MESKGDLAKLSNRLIVYSSLIVIGTLAGTMFLTHLKEKIQRDEMNLKCFRLPVEHAYDVPFKSVRYDGNRISFEKIWIKNWENKLSKRERLEAFTYQTAQHVAVKLRTDNRKYTSLNLIGRDNPSYNFNGYGVPARWFDSRSIIVLVPSDKELKKWEIFLSQIKADEEMKSDKEKLRIKLAMEKEQKGPDSVSRPSVVSPPLDFSRF